jgi:hypothetical protein
MPFCIKCGDDFPQARYDLGYRTCLLHGEAKINFPVIPMTKSNYICGSIEELKQSYGAKGYRPGQ